MTMTSSTVEAISTLKGDTDISVYDQIIGNILKKPDGLELLIACINESFSKLSKRNGLFLLHALLQQCSDEIILKNVDAWMNNSIKFCPAESTSSTAYGIINNLLRLCSEDPESSRDISANLSKIIEEITSTNYNSPNSTFALDCLSNMLQIFSGPCGPYKNAIEKYLISFIDCPFTSENSRIVGKCWNHLQQISGGGVQGNNHKLNWKNQQINLCSTFHQLMDKFLESVPELNSYEQTEQSTLLFPELIQKNNLKLISNRIINIIIYLQEMLISSFPVAKQVLPNSLMEVLTRGLTINHLSFTNKIVSDIIKLSSYLNLIQINLLQLLQTLIICLRTNLIPFSSLICKFLYNMLLKTTSKTADNINTNCVLRCTIYETLTLWLTIAKGTSGLSLNINKIFPILCEDITPFKTEVNLVFTTTKYSNKKDKKKMQEAITESKIAKKYSQTNRKPSNVVNVYQNQICLNALKTIQSILSNDAASLQPQMHKELQEIIIKLIVDNQTGLVKCPYKDENCQNELYKVFIALVLNHHWNVAPPIDYAVILLTKGQTSSNYLISSTCTNGISSVNSLMNQYFSTVQCVQDTNTLSSENNEKKESNATLQKELINSLEIELMNESKQIELQIEKEIKTESLEAEKAEVVVDKMTECEDDLNCAHSEPCTSLEESNQMIIDEDEPKVPEIENERVDSPQEISDDEIITLVLEEDCPISKEKSNTVTIEDDANVNPVTIEDDLNANTVTIEDDANEIEMCSAFVDLVNE